MLIQLQIHIRPLLISRIPFQKLLLDPRHPILILLGSLLIIRIHLSHRLLHSILEYPIQKQLIRQFHIEVDPSLSIPLMDVQQALRPHLELIFSVTFVVGV